MEVMVLKFTPMVVRCLLGALSVCGLKASTSWTHS